MGCCLLFSEWLCTIYDLVLSLGYEMTYAKQEIMYACSLTFVEILLRSMAQPILYNRMRFEEPQNKITRVDWICDKGMIKEIYSYFDMFIELQIKPSKKFTSTQSKSVKIMIMESMKEVFEGNIIL